MEHGFGGVVQPLPFLFIEMAEDGFAGGLSAEMDVGGFPSHGVQEAEFGVGGAQGGEFDAGAVGTEAADDPASAQLDEGIGTADGAGDDGLVEDLSRAAVVLRIKALSPVGGGRDQGFGFAGNAAAVPVGDGYIAGVAETAESGDAVRETIAEAGRGHQMLEGIDGADRGFGFEGGECVHLLPEADGIAEIAFGDAAEPLMLFAQHEGASLFAHGIAIAFEQGTANVLAFEGEASGLGGQMSTDGEADQVDGVGHGPGFVEIVDTPDESAFDVAPGAEIFDVKISDGEDLRGAGKVGTDLRPELRPAVISGAEEQEDVRLHVGVFEAEVLLVDLRVVGQPGFELAGGFDYVHAGNDSGGGMGSQRLSPQRTLRARRQRQGKTIAALESRIDITRKGDGSH